MNYLNIPEESRLMDKLFVNKLSLILMALFESVFFWWLLYRVIADEYMFEKLIFSVPFGLLIMSWPIFYEGFLSDRFRHPKWHLMVKICFYCLLPYGFLILLECHLLDYSLNRLLLSVFVLALFIYINQTVAFLNTTLGEKALMRLYTGKYKQPVEEIRAVMFLDLNDSTKIAEKIGHKRYLSLLNDFFSDISRIVPVYEGEIYKYVGDEIILLWGISDIKNGEPFLCFSEIEKVIAEKREDYDQKYGIHVGFKAGLNLGTVFVGEVGTTKKEIAFIGDTMNIAARLRDQCGALDYPLVYNANLADYFPHSNKPIELGKITLKGKNEPISVYGLKGRQS